MSAAQGSWTLKVDFCGDLRRARSWPSDGASPTVAALREEIAELYRLPVEEVAALVLRYTDDEGDVCTLTQATLPDALWLASSSGHILRITCAPSSNPPAVEVTLGAREAEAAAPEAAEPEAAEPGVQEAPAREGLEPQAAGPDELPSSPDGRTSETETSASASSMPGLERVMQHVEEVRSRAAEEARSRVAELQSTVMAAREDLRSRSMELRERVTERSRELRGQLHGRTQDAQGRATEVRTMAAEAYGQARTAAAEAYSQAHGRVEEARVAATEAYGQARTKAADAYSQASQGDAGAALGLAAAAAVPAAVLALGPGRFARLGLLAAGAMAAVRLSGGMESASDAADGGDADGAQEPQADDLAGAEHT